MFQDGQTSGLVSSLFTWQEDLSSSVERACPGGWGGSVVVVSLDVEILHLWCMRVVRIGRGGVHGLLVFVLYSKKFRFLDPCTILRVESSIVPRLFYSCLDISKIFVSLLSTAVRVLVSRGFPENSWSRLIAKHLCRP